MPPKVFVSHASEDKDRFVIDFATKLRQRGVDAWLDKWEMSPGDSLVDKIFAEGIGQAAAVIVVLSKESVQKPWVREELNAAFVSRVNKGSKLIPVVIDDCEVPNALTSTLWERIHDLSSYENSLDRIVASILGTIDKPPIGALPSYAQSMLTSIGGLTPLDSTVLRLSCEAAIENGHLLVDPMVVFSKDGKLIFAEDQLNDSLEILEQHAYIDICKTISGGLDAYKITTYGFEVYGTECIKDYEGIVKRVISAIVNSGLEDNSSIEETLKEKRVVINHILDLLERNGHIRQAKGIGGEQHIVSVSAGLRRSLNNQSG
jgi:hypothetical protein